MFVDPDWRDRAAGKALVAAVPDHASGIVDEVTLTVVTTDRPASALYERHDFKPYGIEPHAMKTAAGCADEKLMMRFVEAQR